MEEKNSRKEEDSRKGEIRGNIVEKIQSPFAKYFAYPWNYENFIVLRRWGKTDVSMRRRWLSARVVGLSGEVKAQRDVSRFFAVGNKVTHANLINAISFIVLSRSRKRAWTRARVHKSAKTQQNAQYLSEAVLKISPQGVKEEAARRRKGGNALKCLRPIR